MHNYIHRFEEIGCNLKVKFKEAAFNEAAARVVMRELRGGQLINSTVAFAFSYGSQEVYEALSPRINARGETYGLGQEETLEPAA